MEKLIKYLYYISILCFALPSGGILGIPIKILVTFGLLFLFLGSRLIKNQPIRVDGVVRGFVLVMAALSIWACIGIYNGYDTVLMAAKSFLSLLMTVLISYLLIQNKVVSLREAMRALFLTAVLMVGIKLVCEMAMLSGVLDWYTFRDLYQAVTGTVVTTMQIPLGGITVYRIMATNDYLPLVLMGFYLLYEKAATWFKWVVIAVLGVYTFIVYSRVAMLQYAIIVVFYAASLIWDLFRHRTRTKVLWFCLCAGGVLLGAVVMFVWKKDMIISAIATFASSMYERWLGDSAIYSDSFRIEQKAFLWAGIWKTPILGQGLGGYVREYLRSDVVPFSYEAEYLSFIYQFGFLGFILIIGGILGVFAKICFAGIRKNRMWILVLLNFGIWAARPLYNPQFLSSSSGMIIVAIFLAAHYYSQMLKKEEEI